MQFSSSETSFRENKNALIIFIKNPQLGKVKTRLAATLGKEKALEIYLKLFAHTQKITQNLEVDKFLYYSDFINENDIWDEKVYHKSVQNSTPDLGKKMAFAFEDLIQKKYEKVAIIGSDCIELNKEILEKTYENLKENDAVIGPANDGGYYLIGFDFLKIGKKRHEFLKNIFLNKEWSHENVFSEAIQSCKKDSLKVATLPVLIDIDDENDLNLVKAQLK